MTTKTPANLTNMEDATTARWLATTLSQARIDTQAVPTDEAVDRIRERVLGVELAKKAVRSIAA